MPLSIAEQAKNLITKAENILLVAHTKMDGDTLSSTIAMHLLLKKMGKKTTLVCADPVPEIFAFLPATGEIHREFETDSEFVISLDCSQIAAKKLRWKTIGTTLKIFVTPESGSFSTTNLTFSEDSHFDLIISLDAAEKKQLGSIFEENTELFSRTPLLVFDHHASNDGFGVVNIIDTTAASTTEVIFHFLPTLFGEEWKKKIDPDVATLLLTGIITDTGSFQNPNTTPRSLEAAADLSELGARQQEIIRHVFKTKNIPTLKLWGRVLSKIKTDPIHRLLWSTVSSNDLADTGGKTDDLEGIVDELLATAPGMEMVLLIKEREDGIIAASIRTTTPLCDAAEFASEFGGGGHTQAAGLKIRGGKAFEIAVGEIIFAAQRFQKNRLGIAEEDIPPTPSGNKTVPVKISQSETLLLKEESRKYIQEVPEEEPYEEEILEKDEMTPPSRRKDFVEISNSEAESSPQKAEESAFSAAQDEIAQKTSSAAQDEILQKTLAQDETPPQESPPPVPDLSHQEFSSMLEKMMSVDPAKHTQSSS